MRPFSWDDKLRQRSQSYQPPPSPGMEEVEGAQLPRKIRQRQRSEKWGGEREGEQEDTGGAKMEKKKGKKEEKKFNLIGTVIEASCFLNFLDT